MRRALFMILGLAAALTLLGVVALRIPAVQDRIVARALSALTARASAADPLYEPDALHALLCGTSSPLPHPTRAKPCVAVFAGGRFWVVDTGLGSWNQLALTRRVDGARIGGVLLTHFHSDHIGALGEFDLQTWVAGRSGPLQVYGPPGVERVVAGFEEAYALDTRYRIAHHGADLLPEARGRMQALPVMADGPTVVLDEDGMRITAFAVDHAPAEPAYGYRFDYRGRSVVVSGDTVKHAGLIAAAKEADLLVHEAQANHIVAQLRDAVGAVGRKRLEKILSDIPDYHTTPVEAAQAANEAGVGLLIFYHLTPPPPNALLERVFVRGVSDVRADGWLLGQDGTLVTLPADSKNIDVGRI
jgi:ribonuclease Z